MIDNIVPALFGFTLLVFVAIGVWMWWRNREAKRTHEHSSMASKNQRDESPRDSPPQRSS